MHRIDNKTSQGIQNCRGCVKEPILYVTVRRIYNNMAMYKLYTLTSGAKTIIRTTERQRHAFVLIYFIVSIINHF
jgi:hypothetical protein